MSKVFLFVEVNVKPGQFDEFVAKLKSHIAVIRTEAGCEFIDIYRDTQKPDVVNVWEIWSDPPVPLYPPIHPTLAAAQRRGGQRPAQPIISLS